MGVLSIDELKELRSEVVGVIADNPDAMLSDPSLDYTTILELVRTTGRTDLLRVVLDKIRQIEDKAVQSAAWVEVLDAIEIEISLGSAVEQEKAQEGQSAETLVETAFSEVTAAPQPEQFESQPSHETEHQHQEEHHQQ